MTDTTNKDKFKGLKMFFLALILIGFPAIGWYFFQQATDFRKDALEEMGDYGKLQWKDKRTVTSRLFTPDSVQNKVILAGFYQYDNKEDEVLILSQAKQLNNQFGLNPNNWMFVIPLGLGDSTQLALPPDVNIGKLEKRRTHFFKMDSDQNELDSYGLKLKNLDQPQWLLVDKYGIIRNYYDANDNKSLKDLVVHAGICIPDFKKR